MQAAQLERHFVAVMAKHLPPSPSRLKLLDIGGRAGPHLADRRADIDLTSVAAPEFDLLEHEADAFDAVVALDAPLDEPLLRTALQVLRPGGRFVAVLSHAVVSSAHPRMLRESGFVRILVEPALDEIGVLLRGEKAHLTSDTAQRIRAVADVDADLLNLETFRGRYLHLLIQQRPNKPIWKLQSADILTWRAVALKSESKPIALAFSSLPKAVAFMQPAVLAGFVRDINKVGKFSRAAAQSWGWDLLLNPAVDCLRGATITLLDIDPAAAEAPDE